MPNSPSAKKAQRQNEKRRLENRSKRSALRTAVKKVRVSAETGGGDTDALLKAAQKKLDRSAAHGLIHPNKAARLKSRLMKQLAAGETA